MADAAVARAVFLEHLTRDSEAIADSDVPEGPDAFDLFRSQVALATAAGATGRAHQFAHNVAEQQKEIDKEFERKIREGRAAIERSSGVAIAKADHGPHGVTREKCADGRIRVTTVSEHGMKVEYVNE